MKRILCLILIFLAAFAYAKPNIETAEERDWSWLNDEKLYQEKLEHSWELLDKYGHNFVAENFSVTLKKRLFKKNTVIIKYQNISDKDLHIFRYIISTNDEFSVINSCYKIYDSKNNAVPYAGIFADRFSDIYEDFDFILIKSGHNIKNEVDLSKFFELNPDEVYTVKFECSDVVSNTITIND